MNKNILVMKKCINDSPFILGLIVTIIIILVFGIRYYLSGYFLFETIDNQATNSFFVAISAIITPLWAAIAVYIYYQNLLEIRRQTFESTLLEMIKRVDGLYKPQEFNKIYLLFIGAKYAFSNGKICRISSYEELENQIDNLETKDEVEEYEDKCLMYSDYDSWLKKQKEEKLKKLSLKAIYYLKLSEESKKEGVSDDENAFTCVQDSFGYVFRSFVEHVENTMIYIDDNGFSREKHQKWVMSSLSMEARKIYELYRSFKKA